MSADDERKRDLEEMRKRTLHSLAAGLERVNVHPRDETGPAAPDRVKAFHRSLGLPEDVDFLRDGD